MLTFFPIASREFQILFTHPFFPTVAAPGGGPMTVNLPVFGGVDVSQW